MNNDNPYIRLIIFGKIKKMMMSYVDSKLKNLDRNLIRGIYLRHLKDFEENQKEKMENKTLYQRLTGGGQVAKGFNALENT